MFSPDGTISGWDEDLDGNSLDDQSNGYFFIDAYPEGDVYGFITNTDLDTPFVADPSEWGHGDMVAKKLFENLENPGHTYILGIDSDNNEDFNYLFSDPGTGITNFEKIVADYLDYKSYLWPENEFNLIGYSFSWEA